MTIYYIDKENVNTNWGTVVLDLGAKKGDVAVIYYTGLDNAKTECMWGLDDLEKAGVYLKYERTPFGENALDTYLVSSMSAIVGKTGDNIKHVILSNDKGFEGAVLYWREKGKTIRRETHKKQKMMSYTCFKTLTEEEKEEIQAYILEKVKNVQLDSPGLQRQMGLECIEKYGSLGVAVFKDILDVERKRRTTKKQNTKQKQKEEPQVIKKTSDEKMFMDKKINEYNSKKITLQQIHDECQKQYGGRGQAIFKVIKQKV